jgi:hypothetical protein
MTQPVIHSPSIVIPGAINTGSRNARIFRTKAHNKTASHAPPCWRSTDFPESITHHFKWFTMCLLLKIKQSLLLVSEVQVKGAISDDGSAGNELRSCLVTPKFNKQFTRSQPQPLQRGNFERGFFLYFLFLT